MVNTHKNVKLVSNFIFKSCVYIVDLFNGCVMLLAQCTCLYLPLTGEGLFLNRLILAEFSVALFGVSLHFNCCLNCARL